MGKIDRIDTTKNLECFPRTLNRQNPDRTYFIDSQRNTSPFKRLFAAPIANNAKVYPNFIGSMGDGVAFENSDTWSETLASKTIENGRQVFSYKCSGAVNAFTDEQVAAWGETAVAGETKFCVIAYATNMPNATQRKVGWVQSETSDFDADAQIRTLDKTGINSTVLGLTGPGTVSNGRQFYRVDVMDKDETAICTYIWDLSDFIVASKQAKTAPQQDVTTRTSVNYTSAASEVERLIQSLKTKQI